MKLKPDTPALNQSDLQAPSQGETKATSVSQPPLSRRAMFGFSVLGLSAAMASACSGSTFNAGTENGTSRNSNKPGAGGATEPTNKGKGGPGSEGEDTNKACLDGDCPAGEGGTDTGGSGTSTKGSKYDGEDTGTLDDGEDTGTLGDGEDTGTGGETDGANDTADCKANTTTELDLNAIPEATGGLVPTFKLYGKDSSALLALKFADAGVSQVIVCREDGKMLALQGITSADRAANNNLRPMIIDNLNISATNNLKILVTKGADRYVATLAKEYFTSFQGKSVVDLSQGAMAAYQSVAQFTEGSGFNMDANVSYPTNGQGPRNLMTAASTSTWTKGAGVKGTITDIMGDSIDINGNGLLENQTFCTYVVSGPTAYRTILRVG